MNRQDRTGSFVAAFNTFLATYRIYFFIAVAVLASVGILLAQVVSDVQEFLLDSGLIAFLTLIVLLDLAAAEHLAKKSDSLEIVHNQDKSLPLLCDAVGKCKNASIDLLEYAGATTLPLIRAIARENVPMRMLVKHPETVQGLQRQRMITTLDTIYNSIFSSPAPGGATRQFEIRCYRQPYSLRARRLGERLLELGWLTPDMKGQTTYGHANPSLLASSSDDHYDNFREFFDRTFNDLWQANDTEDAMSVLVTAQAEP